MSKTIDDQSRANKNSPGFETRLSFLVYFYWYCIGNVLLVVFAFLTAFGAKDWFGLCVGLYWITALSLIGARYLDIWRFNGLTTDDEPATIGHWIRYSRNLLIVALILFWAVFSIRKSL
ncbi:MAG: hypothetical protein V1913_15860 [Fibrobacterota bacterium]